VTSSIAQRIEHVRRIDTPKVSLYNRMVAVRDTRGDTTRSPKGQPSVVAGAIVVFAGTPRFQVFTLASTLAIGRDDPVGALLDDERLSRHHAHIRRDGDDLLVSDLESRNGTFVDGRSVREKRIRGEHVVRAGGTLLITCDDVSSFAGKHVRKEGSLVIGTRFAEALAHVERAGRAGDAVLVRGETGTGKEIVARRYHEATAHASGPFCAFNCANIPEGLAERLLFGARRGAYTGATSDSEGVIEAADGGTLFLDEVGELDLGVQAKLLRVLETREILPLGASRPRTVDVRFCFATNRDLRADVAHGRFRDDLFFRLGTREVVTPPIRERREDIPWLLASAAGEVDATLGLHAKLVEECMLRPWPGNVRELLREGKHAAELAAEAGERVVRAEHLRETAGQRIASEPHEGPSPSDVRAALTAASGNVSEAARTLGVHRTQLRRAMRKLGLAVGKS
jgi:transcriptional regulator of acetoin/glycerol metabolism